MAKSGFIEGAKDTVTTGAGWGAVVAIVLVLVVLTATGILAKLSGFAGKYIPKVS